MFVVKRNGNKEEFNSSKVKLKDFTSYSRRLNYNNYKSLKTELELRIFG